MSLGSLVRFCSRARLSRPAQQLSVWRRYGSIAETTSVQLESGSLTVGGNSYHPTWLRHNCQCPECWFATSGQKIVDLSEVSTRNTVKNAKISDGRLELTWSSGHQGYIGLDWLEKFQRSIEDNSTPPIATEVPLLDGSDMIGNKEKIWQWLYNINEYGLCVLTNMGTSKTAIVQLANTMYSVQPTYYGETFEVISVENPSNLAYSSGKLNFHQDQPYYQGGPGMQMLHCLEFDKCVVGGESVLVDFYGLAEILREKHPEHFDTLSRVPATFERVHYKRDDPVDIKCSYPHIELDSQKRVVALRWTPASEGPLDVPDEDVGPYYKAYEYLNWLMYNNDITLVHRLKPGEILTFNNRRFLHTRKIFDANGGHRFLHGTYVDIDHVKSTFTVLNEELSKNAKIRRFFNSNSY